MINKFKNSISRLLNTKSYQYSQVVDEVVYYWCWFFSNIIAMSSLTGQYVELPIWKEWLAYIKANGIPTDEGQPLERGIEFSVPLWNKTFPTAKCKATLTSFGAKGFWRHIFTGRPAVIWINISELFKQDRADGVLQEMLYRKKDITSTHAIVLMRDGEGYYLLESDSKGSKYRVTREYLETVSGLIIKNKAILFDFAD